MRQIPRVLAGALVIMCAVARTHGAGQQSVSTELKMLISRPGGESIDPKPGPPPADFPKEILPRGTVPVASGVSGTSTIVVGTLADRSSRWRTELLSSVSAFGWISTMPEQSGFVMGPFDSTAFCKGSDFANVTLVTAAGGGTNVRATLTRDPRRQCAGRSAGSTTWFADVMLPVLEAPSGAKVTGAGSGGGSNEWTSHAVMTSDLALASLADHYVRQILDLGWTQDAAPAIFDNSMIIRFKAPSKLGGTLPAMLIINAFDEKNQFDVFIRLTRPDRTDYVGAS